MSFLAGTTLTGWTAVQVEMLGYRMWWQPVCLTLGLVTVLFSLRSPRRDRTGRGMIMEESQRPARASGMLRALRRGAINCARVLLPLARGAGTGGHSIRHIGDPGNGSPEERHVADRAEIHRDGASAGG